MDDRDSHEEGELFTDTDQADDTTPGASDTDSADLLTDEGEQEQGAADIDLEDSDSEQESGKTSKAEVNKLKQVNAWVKKIEEGVADLDELPKNLGWLKKDIEARLEVKPDVKEIVRQELAQEKASMKFELMKENLQDIDLTPTQKEKLEASFKKLRSKGLDKVDSLEAAMEIAGVDFEASAIDSRRRRMALPKPGKGAAKFTTESLKNAPYSEVKKAIPSREKRMEFLRSLNPEPGIGL